MKTIVSALVCLIMYMAKVRSREKELEAIFPQTGLKDEFKPTFVNVSSGLRIHYTFRKWS